MSTARCAANGSGTADAPFESYLLMMGVILIWLIRLHSFFVSRVLVVRFAQFGPNLAGKLQGGWEVFFSSDRFQNPDIRPGVAQPEAR